MSWNFRLVERDGHFAVHEAYYDEAGEVRAWTRSPVTVSGDAIADIEWMLERMLADVRRHPPIVGAGQEAGPRIKSGVTGKGRDASG